MKLLCSAVFCLMVIARANATNDQFVIEKFDEAQKFTAEGDSRVYALYREADPRMSEWCDRMAEMKEAERKVERYGFLLLLREKPAAIDFDATGEWLHCFAPRSDACWALAKADPIFDKLFRDYLAKDAKTALDSREVSRLMDGIREKVLVRRLEIEERRVEKMKTLSAEITKKRANQSPEPMPLKRHGPP